MIKHIMPTGATSLIAKLSCGTYFKDKDGDLAIKIGEKGENSIAFLFDHNMKIVYSNDTRVTPLQISFYSLSINYNNQNTPIFLLANGTYFSYDKQDCIKISNSEMFSLAFNKIIKINNPDLSVFSIDGEVYFNYYNMACDDEY